VEHENTAELAEARTAEAILNRTLRQNGGASLEERLAAGRPFSPEEYRYLDPPYEYSDGSVADDIPHQVGA
jgi:hypothetical protein